MEATDELTMSSEELMSNMEAAIKEILLTAGWTLAAAELYCTTGLLTRMTRNMILNYTLLHQHIYQLYMNNPSEWEDKALLHLQYHAKQLLRTRKNAINRFQMWLRTYVILRDARAKGYVDVKLLGQLMTRPAHTVTKLPTTASQKWDCAHCHTKGLHEGGQKTCPAQDLQASIARKLG
jgi:hypothetical protein